MSTLLPAPSSPADIAALEQRIKENEWRLQNETYSSNQSRAAQIEIQLEQQRAELARLKAGVVPGGSPAQNTEESTTPGPANNKANDDNPQTSDVSDLGEIVVTAKRPVSSPANAPIVPLPNILDEYANYTYEASVYLMTPAQLNSFQRSKKKSVNGYNLLFQSGGAPNNVGGPQGALGTAYAASKADLEAEGIGFVPAVGTPGPNSPESGRNPFFPNDFYIDSITIENTPLGKGTMSAHGVTQLKFTVIEPANITLLDCMYKAVQDMQPLAGKTINYAAACYLMIIRFYGYDINGKQAKVSPLGDSTNQTDTTAVVEKYIPFRIKDINWEVSSKLVSYEFDCAPIGQLVAGGTRRGTIPADIEISGQTVGELLVGGVAANNPTSTTTAAGQGNRTDENQSDAETARLTRQSTPAPPPNASAAQQKSSLRTGLIGAMNAEQQRLVKAGEYSVADEYEIVFADGAEKIRDATLTKPGDTVNKGATDMGPAPQQDPSGMSPDKGKMNTNSRNQGITAGMQMVQAIEIAIRNSNFVTNQATTVVDESDEDNAKANGVAKNGTFTYYSLAMSVQQLDYDEKRNDFAYRVRYTIIPYTPVDFQSPYFPRPKFRGVVKSYPYWFTGANSSVLDYKANFNKLYTLTVSGSAVENSLLAADRKAYLSSMRDLPFVQHQARSTESGQGGIGRVNDIAANAAEYLYNPANNGEGEITIVGDPAWIQQGSAVGELDPKNINYKPFAPDGTINFDSMDVLFEIAWQRPEDYNHGSGLADPYGKPQSSFGDRQPQQSVVYRVKGVTSEFRQGRFQQKVKGVLYLYPISGQVNKTANTTSTPDLDASGRQTATTDPRVVGRSAQNPVDALTDTARGIVGKATGPILAPMNNMLVTPFGSGKFTPAPVDPADTVSSAPPPKPVSSNGEVASEPSTGTAALEQKIKENEWRLQNETYSSNQSRAAQIESELEQQRAALARLRRSSQDSSAARTVPPQVISREF